ncbi:MAG: type II toxin-antitoxin system YafQ family toxin [Rhodothermaceae bacterium]|nr:type II toxin-antitoxin system YafQ family toxin [Rhodothermaceae bacterium]MYC04308.1 type II toxin-antitoxin system YafQ family toxin [Rhodothermaceae bacterium]MYI16660.1 type II toxin-antitoxin system YafQ family toxin [Rhodothermaceae bacterium]
MRVTRSTKFKKQYRLAVKRGRDPAKIKELVSLLETGDPLPAIYRDKKLSGDFNAYRSARLGGDWRLIYRRSENELLLVALGTHSDLFKNLPNRGSIAYAPDHINLPLAIQRSL